MKVAIVMGSKSDYPVVQKAEAHAEKFGVEYETRIISAHRTPKQAEEFAANAEAERIWMHHRSGRKSCASGRRAGGNDAASGNRYTDEIQHYGRTGFAAFRGTDAKRRAGSHRGDRRSGKRSDPGSPDPERQQIRLCDRSHQGFQEKTGRRYHRAGPMNFKAGNEETDKIRNEITQEEEDYHEEIRTAL